MPKRGERATHRVRFAWVDTEPQIKGVISCMSEWDANHKVSELQRTAAQRSFKLEVSIEEIVRKDKS